MEKITNERWQKAQNKELADHALIVNLEESKRFLMADCCYFVHEI